MINYLFYSIVTASVGSSELDQGSEYFFGSEGEAAIENIISSSAELEKNVYEMYSAATCADPGDLLTATIDCRAKARRNCGDISIRRLRRICEGAVMSACLAEALYKCTRRAGHSN